MRLWHYALIKELPDKQLLGQHRECCALRGNGWGRKHSTVDYVFRHSYLKLFFYHLDIIREMLIRRHEPDGRWQNELYRGKKIGFVNKSELPNIEIVYDKTYHYDEHDKEYLHECVNNLKSKGVEIDA